MCFYKKVQKICLWVDIAQNYNSTIVNIIYNISRKREMLSSAVIFQKKGHHFLSPISFRDIGLISVIIIFAFAHVLYTVEVFKLLS